MSFWIRLVGGACVVWLAVALSGCTPSGRSQLSEEKEPHFVQGKGLVNAMDFQGAIEAFGQSLEANPHSAAAHFELGWLFDEKASDPAAAIFHYQQYLKLNPNADQLTLEKTMPLAGLEPGKYQVTIKVNDGILKQQIDQSAPFIVEQ